MEQIKQNLRKKFIKWIKKNHPGINLNFTVQDVEIFDSALEPVKETLKTLHEDCEMALNNDWDRSDDGFEAMKDSIEKILEI